MKFRFEDYQVNYVMWCKTEEEAKDFCRVMHESGRKWNSGDSYIESTKFLEYLDETCYNFNMNTYSDRDDYIVMGFTILEWSDFMEKKFTLSDLKVGMLVVVRCGYKYLVAKNDNEGMFFTNEEGWTEYNTKHNDMRSAMCEDFDIMKVYSMPSKNKDAFNYSTENRTLLFERKEPKELTMQEIADKFGIPVEQLKIKK